MDEARISFCNEPEDEGKVLKVHLNIELSIYSL